MSTRYVHSDDHGKATLVEAARALIAVVRAEYGDRWSLAYIAGTWGDGATPDQLEALSHVETLLGEMRCEVLHDRCEDTDVERTDPGD